MKDPSTTPRDIRLELANLLDRLGQVQNTEAWETEVMKDPLLELYFKSAQDSLDSLWWNWRQRTTTSDYTK